MRSFWVTLEETILSIKKKNNILLNAKIVLLHLKAIRNIQANFHHN